MTCISREASPDIMCVDRNNRDRLADVVRRFLDGELTCVAFDSALLEIRDDTDDPTVEYVANECWYFYDDFKDHHVRVAKCEWDYAQRLILLLQSDARVAVEQHWTWSLSQVVAAATLAACGLSLMVLGLGWYLVAVMAGMGALSFAITRWRDYDREERTALQGAPPPLHTTPFASTRQILTVRRRVPGFAKRPISPEVSSRASLSPIKDKARSLAAMIVWTVYSPLLLIYLSFPRQEFTFRVELP